MRLDFLSAPPDRAGIGAQIEQRAHAVAKHKGQQGDRDQRTGHPQHQSPTRVTADARHQRRGFENTGTDDDTDDQRQGRQGMKQAQRLRLLLNRSVDNR
jgi:hypothetical protein